MEDKKQSEFDKARHPEGQENKEPKLMDRAPAHLHRLTEDEYQVITGNLNAVLQRLGLGAVEARYDTLEERQDTLNLQLDAQGKASHDLAKDKQTQIDELKRDIATLFHMGGELRRDMGSVASQVGDRLLELEMESREDHNGRITELERVTDNLSHAVAEMEKVPVISNEAHTASPAQTPLFDTKPAMERKGPTKDATLDVESEYEGLLPMGHSGGGSARTFRRYAPISEPEDKPIPSCTLSDIMDKLDRHSTALDLMQFNQLQYHREVTDLLSLSVNKIEALAKPTIKEAETFPEWKGTL